MIRKFLNFALPFCVFIHPCRIRESYISEFLVSLEGFSISCSKLNSAILFNYFSCIQVIKFWILVPYIFLTNACAILYFHQYSYDKCHIDCFHQLKSRFSHVLPLPHLISCTTAGLSHQLHTEI